ncbi:sterol O-acyltransferase 2-like [Rana temporaria]|uniref:sterol O-acyltransferase 2-like n=1 Tax=Rana temporaria TaxID=8407 RepID=UPI001AAD1F61|nr:sterol O-acyltransferase 2-like [Rana temporaria]
MAATEDSSDSTVRNRNSDHTKDQTCAEQNGPEMPGQYKYPPNDPFLESRQSKGVKADIVEDVSNHLGTLRDEAMTEKVQSHRSQGSMSGRRKTFVHRASLLDDLNDAGHLQIIYNICVAVFCVFMISNTAVEIIDHGRLIDPSLFIFAFGQPGTVAWSWICLFTYTLLVPYKALVVWGSLYPKSNHKIMLSAFVGILLLVGQTCVLCIFPFYVVKHYQLPPASGFIVIIEQFRFIMKSYSLLREVVPTVLQKEQKEVQLPKLSSYLYFLFCPTVIYRDSYPRNPYIRWKYLIKCFAEILGCLLFLYYIVDNLCIPVFTNMSKQPFSVKTLVLSIFHATLPGTLVLLIAFFGFLHCWHNAFAEMLCFADRMFYKDWWNATSFSNYFRTWNVMIHDWLFYYVYQDLLWLLNKKFRSAVTLAVFLLSASVHEYAYSVALGYFYPVVFCLFAILGVLLNFSIKDKQKSPVFNVIVWTSLFMVRASRFLYTLRNGMHGSIVHSQRKHSGDL